MIEKGLTMQPRRVEFARGYIEGTVDSLRLASEAKLFDLDLLEWAWLRSVLQEYFDVTINSTASEIVRARETFKSIVEPMPAESCAAGPHNPSVTNAAVGIDELLELATGRRSVRWFIDKPVDRSIVDRAMLVAAEAPTACNRQPYRFEVFDDPASVGKVAAIPMGTRGYRDQIPGIIVVIGDLSAFFDERDRHLIYIDGCLASMSLIHGLEAQGIGTCCINWPDMPGREAQMRELLGLQPYERVVMLLAFGYADPDGLVPYSAKKDISDVRQFRKL